MKPPRYIFVVGPMRSGTSLIARLLESHPDYTFGGEANHNGENTAFMAKNRELLRCIGGGETSGTPSSANRIAGPLRIGMENWLRFLESDQPEGGFVLKDPCACCTLGLWLSLVENAAVVVTLRDMACIADSLVATQPSMDMKTARDYVGLHYECLFRNLSEHRVQVEYVQYEHLMGSCLDVLGPLGRRLHLTDDLATIAAFSLDTIDHDLWHFRPEDGE